MLSGKSLDLLLAAAAATGKLKSFARKFIKWVKWSGAVLHSSNRNKTFSHNEFFVCVGSMSFRSTLAVKDVSLNKKVGFVPVRSEWLVFDLLFPLLLLFSSQVSLSSGPALWHFLPHAVPCGADLRLRGESCMFVCFYKNNQKEVVLDSVKIFLTVTNTVLHFLVYRWSCLNQVPRERRPSLKLGSRHVCLRRARLWTPTTPASDRSLAKWRAWWRCSTTPPRWSWCKSQAENRRCLWEKIGFYC